jgi:ERF superfamily
LTDLPSVVQAWSECMADVQGIRKGERNKQQNFTFRGIDTVMNAVGPVLRKHRVAVVPTPEDITLTTYVTSGGTTMHSAVVKMRYTIHGPAGDTIEGGAYGEAADAGDKAVSKAESVAYRVFLLQGLTIPTDEPDPDAEAHQRASRTSGPAPQPPMAPSGGRGAGPGNPAAQAFTQAANALDGSQRAQLRLDLIHAGLPSSVQDMDEDQADAALSLLNRTFNGADA